MNLKPYAIQTATSGLPPDVAVLSRVDYVALNRTLHYPLLWVYEELLQAWLPHEVDEDLIDRLRSYTGNDERLERRLAMLGLVNEFIPAWDELAIAMKRDGFVVVQGLFSAGMCKQMVDYYERQPELHERWPDLPGIKRTSVNDSPLMRLAHQSTEALARYMLGDIKTSYSFTASYEVGTILPRHIDRSQCVYNASIMLGIDPLTIDPKAWPLMIEIDGRVNVVKLNIGDAVFYSGVKNPHWRDIMPNGVNKIVGTFFHFVPTAFTGSLA